jgi:hypothetical protein
LAIADNYDETIKNLEALRSLIINDNEINDCDFNLLIGTIEVAKNSANLWMNNFNGFGTGARKLKANGKSVVRADAAASSAYFTGIGVNGVFRWATPATATALLGGWAVSAGLGSAYHYFGIE